MTYFTGSQKNYFKILYYICYRLILSSIDLIFKYISFFFIKKYSSKNILITRLDSIGDFVLWFNFFNYIINHYKNYNITLVCSSSIASYVKLHFRQIKIIECSKFKFLFNIIYRYNFLFKINRFKYSIVINPLRSRDYIFSDVIIKNIFSDKKISYLDNNNEANLFSNIFKNNIYSHFINLNHASITHEIEFNMEFTKRLLSNKKLKFDKYTIPTKNYLKYGNIENSVVIVPGAKDSKRVVGLNKILEFIEIKKISNYKFYILGDLNDRKIFSNFQNKIFKNFIFLFGSTKLDEYFFLIKKCKYIICNDSSAGHLGHLFKKKTFLFLGGGHFKRFFPYPKKYQNMNNFPEYYYHKLNCFNCNWLCKYDKWNLTSYPCIEKIKLKTTNIKL